MNPTWQVILVVISAFASLTSSLVLYAFKRHVARIDKLEENYVKLSQRKQDCQNEFVGSGAWIREAGYTRQRLDDAIAAVERLSAKVELKSEIPLIASQVAAATVAEMMKRLEKS
jgi:hypothetical protein